MSNRTHRRNVVVGAGLVVLLAALGLGQFQLQKAAAAQAKNGVMAPRFEVDPLWPKPMPNHWVLGQTIGVWVDTDDHVWIVHRSSSTLADNEKGIELKTATCCAGGAAGSYAASGVSSGLLPYAPHHRFILPVSASMTATRLLR